MITNNINGDAFIMRNDLNGPAPAKNDAPAKNAGNNYLTIRLAGDSLNREGIGTTVYAYSKGLAQVVEQYPVRGYLSTVDSRLHFGVGQNAIDSLRIVWPDERTQVIPHPPLNAVLTLDHRNASPERPVPKPLPDPLFTDITQQINADFRHQETFFYDYAFQP